MTFADIQRMVDRLGSVLDRPVAVDDSKLRLVAFNSVARVENDEARELGILNREVGAATKEWVFQQRPAEQEGVFEIPANPAVGMTFSRWGAAARADGNVAAYVWVLVTEGRLSLEEEKLLLSTAAEVGASLDRERLYDELRTLQEREGLLNLLSEDGASRVDAAERLIEAGLFEEGTACTAITLLPVPRREAEGATEERHALERAVEAARLLFASNHFLATVRPSHAVLVIARPSDATRMRFHSSHEIAQAIASRFSEILRDLPARPYVGIGRRQKELSMANESYREALQAAQVASVIEGLGSPIHFNRLGVYGKIAQLSWSASDRTRLHPGIKALIDREELGDPLAHTLEVFLDNAGNAVKAATELHLHRASLYARLRRIEGIASLNLDDGRDRLVAHLELKLTRLMKVRARRISQP